MTGGMLLLVYGSVRARVALAGDRPRPSLHANRIRVSMIAFAVNELRSRNPLVPFAILRVKGLVAAGT